MIARPVMMALVMGAALAVPTAAAEPPPADRRALQQLAKQMDQAWNTADVDANAALFAVDATARFGNDPLGEGRPAILQQFRGFFENRPPGLRHVTRIERIDRLSNDLALWDAEVRVERLQPDKSWAIVTRIRNVTLVERQSDGWRIRAVRAFPA